jgi:integrase/recombinase XerD
MSFDRSFDHFIRERKYVHNVSPRTLEWYACAFRWLPHELPSADDLKEAVIHMREAGLKPTTVNSYLRVFNAYCHWLHSPDTKCSPACTAHPHLRPQAEPKEVMPTYTDAQVKALIRWKPAGRLERRLHLLVLLMLDTGCRISEATGLHLFDVDFDNLLVKFNGKGNKQRLIPISMEYRKVLYRYLQSLGALSGDTLLFPMERNNVQRAVKTLCKRLGFTPPVRVLHSLRHTFALNYLQRGGSTFHLQKMLGHSSLEMTRRYSNLSTADLSAVHGRLTLLTR